MDQCLKDLDDAREYETDQLLIQLIHIQKLTEKIFHFHSSDSPMDEISGERSISGPSTMARLETLRAELDGLRNALPEKLKSDCMNPQTSKSVASDAALINLKSQTFYLATTTMRVFEFLSP